MRLLAKGILPNGYWGFGRHWPRAHAVEVTIDDPAEVQRILADDHIVAIVIPEVQNAPPSSAKDNKPSKRA